MFEGMNFEMHEMSQEISSNWVAAVPRLLKRRGAIIQQTHPQGMAPASSQSGNYYYCNIPEADLGLRVTGLQVILECVERKE